MQFGLFGMVLMSWCLILAIITKDIEKYWKVSQVVYYISSYLMIVFLLIFASYHTEYHVKLDDEKSPFVERNLFILGVGIAHIIVAFAIFMTQVYWLECLIILFASFIYSIDLYWVSTIDAYTIQKHYHYEWQFDPREDIYYNAIITCKRLWKDYETIEWSLV
ncbi:hypothetical protein GCK72_004911 [Caenorhabditis remanei]|nr:hypothetical protein GCK72_004911 [Caenorhabditis remanei]KAF1764960.1 hypothetical protein GCK72_004911 [Caenorhabditis remanei]